MLPSQRHSIRLSHSGSTPLVRDWKQVNSITQDSWEPEWDQLKSRLPWIPSQPQKSLTPNKPNTTPTPTPAPPPPPPHCAETHHSHVGLFGMFPSMSKKARTNLSPLPHERNHHSRIQGGKSGYGGGGRQQSQGLRSNDTDVCQDHFFGKPRDFAAHFHCPLKGCQKKRLVCFGMKEWLYTLNLKIYVFTSTA